VVLSDLLLYVEFVRLWEFVAHEQRQHAAVGPEPQSVNLDGRRSWTGLHHHALLSMIALGFLQYLRLGGKRPRKRLPRTGPPPRPTLPEVRRYLREALTAIRLKCPHCKQVTFFTRRE
jgi:hypothetical protein